MLAWIVVFFVLALIAGALGFGGLSSTFAWLAQILCVIFLVLFVAEWGDLSQLLTAGLVVRYQDPVSVGVGAFLALALVSGLGALLGRQLLSRVRLATIRRIGGGLCLLLSVLSMAQVLGLNLPVG